MSSGSVPPRSIPEVRSAAFVGLPQASVPTFDAHHAAAVIAVALGASLRQECLLALIHVGSLEGGHGRGGIDHQPPRRIPLVHEFR